jgi:hypothetical protein
VVFIIDNPQFIQYGYMLLIQMCINQIIPVGIKTPFGFHNNRKRKLKQSLEQFKGLAGNTGVFSGDAQGLAVVAGQFQPAVQPQESGQLSHLAAPVARYNPGQFILGFT